MPRTYQVHVTSDPAPVAEASIFISVQRRDALEHYGALLSEQMGAGWEIADLVERSSWSSATSGVVLGHPALPDQSLEIALTETY